MPIFLDFEKHIDNSIKHTLQAHRSLLRAAQSHDDQNVAIILREAVHTSAVLQEIVEQLQGVKRNTPPGPGIP